MTTSARDNTPGDGALRDGRGRFRRSLTSVDRAARAAELVSRGWTYEGVAAELGYCDRSAAWRAVQGVLAATLNRVGLREAKLKQLAELQQLRLKLWETVDSPPPLTDRLGRVVVDPATGAPVPDEAARQGAMALIIRTSEREARLFGTDAPRTSMSVDAKIASISPEDLHAYLEHRKAEIAETHAFFGIPEEPPAVPGAVEASQGTP